MTNYLDINKKLWNERTDIHVKSEMYEHQQFLAGQSSLKSIELEMLANVAGRSVLHLQCHFGQDSLSLARMGTKVTGVDFSDKAIDVANQTAQYLNLDARFICSDVYELPHHLDEMFDLVFTTYGVIGWLPDMDKWASVISHFLKPGGQLVFVEFHPVVWMFDDYFKFIQYRYFKSDPIIETGTGTYADRTAEISDKSMSWNHSISEVVNALIKHGLQIDRLDEFDYSPHNCFNETIEVGMSKFRIKHLDDKIPMTYSILASKGNENG